MMRFGTTQMKSNMKIFVGLCEKSFWSWQKSSYDRRHLTVLCIQFKVVCNVKGFKTECYGPYHTRLVACISVRYPKSTSWKITHQSWMKSHIEHCCWSWFVLFFIQPICAENWKSKFIWSVLLEWERLKKDDWII